MSRSSKPRRSSQLFAWRFVRKGLDPTGRTRRNGSRTEYFPTSLLFRFQDLRGNWDGCDSHVCHRFWPIGGKYARVQLYRSQNENPMEFPVYCTSCFRPSTIGSPFSWNENEGGNRKTSNPRKYELIVKGKEEVEAPLALFFLFCWFSLQLSFPFLILDFRLFYSVSFPRSHRIVYLCSSFKSFSFTGGSTCEVFLRLFIFALQSFVSSRSFHSESFFWVFFLPLS